MAHRRDFSCLWIRWLVDVVQIAVLSISSTLDLVVGVTIHADIHGNLHFLASLKKETLIFTSCPRKSVLPLVSLLYQD